MTSSGHFPMRRRTASRLVLTQSTYLLQAWIDRLDEGDRIVATADRAALASSARRRRCRGAAPGGSSKSSIWMIRNVTGTQRTQRTQRFSWKICPLCSLCPSRRITPSNKHLASAYVLGERARNVLRLCREAVALEPESAVAHLALASACREDQRRRRRTRRARSGNRARAGRARRRTTKARKLWLACDDLPRARDGFQRAADLMPSFVGASDQPRRHARRARRPGGGAGRVRAARSRYDPAAPSAPEQHRRRQPRARARSNDRRRRCGAWSNSPRASSSATTTSGTPYFLLAGMTPRSRAYEDGQRLDPQKNPRQACRLAMVRLATAIPPAQSGICWRAANAAPPEEREDLLLEAFEIAHALAAAAPRAGRRRRARLSSIASAPKSSNPSKLEPMDTPDSGQPIGRGVGPSVRRPAGVEIAACGLRGEPGDRRRHPGRRPLLLPVPVDSAISASRRRSSCGS